MPTDDRHARLSALATGDVVRALALERAPRPIRAAVGLAFRRPVRRLARDLVAFDDDLGRRGLRPASLDLLARFVPDLDSSGGDALPADGPLLVVANHPGLFDAIALFAAIERDDLRVVALDHPFTAALPHLRERIIEVPATGPRQGVVRAMLEHLGAGGAVLTFPAGTIEPDPAVRPGADASLAAWVPTPDALARRLPGLRVAGAVVSGVHTRRGLEHPLTRLRREASDRDWFGAVLQLLVARLRTRSVRVDVGPALEASEVDGSLSDAVLRTVRERLASIG